MSGMFGGGGGSAPAPYVPPEPPPPPLYNANTSAQLLAQAPIPESSSKPTTRDNYTDNSEADQAVKDAQRRALNAKGRQATILTTQAGIADEESKKETLGGTRGKTVKNKTILTAGR